MYPQQQNYQQPGYGAGYNQPYGQQYPQSGYAQPGYPQSNYPQGPAVNLNMGPQTQPGFMSGGGGGGGGGFMGAPDPAGLFQEKAIRQAFVSKVYSILTVQLIFTSILIAAFVLNNDTKVYFKQNQSWLFLGMAIFFVTYLILACIESARRTVPCNFILLTILTFGYGFLAAVVSCRYKEHVVLYAFVATAASCFLIALFAQTTSFDMTNCGTTLCILGLAHMIIGGILALVLASMGYARMGSLILSISGAFLVSLYLIFDIQIIMGGRKGELSPENYILGAILLYVDILQMFLYMLEIFSRLSDD